MFTSNVPRSVDFQAVISIPRLSKPSQLASLSTAPRLRRCYTTRSSRSVYFPALTIHRLFFLRPHLSLLTAYSSRLILFTSLLHLTPGRASSTLHPSTLRERLPHATGDNIPTRKHSRQLKACYFPTISPTITRLRSLLAFDSSFKVVVDSFSTSILHLATPFPSSSQFSYSIADAVVY